jgi:hypothetical protein
MEMSVPVLFLLRTTKSANYYGIIDHILMF